MQLIGDTEIHLVEHETAERDVAAGWLSERLTASPERTGEP